ncbi:hypothetical protein HDV01_001727 [Terramyces sp. JEL0728]|nr:hypothetical protein HDV01_001727 [Terramyces sp. JEL0728]
MPIQELPLELHRRIINYLSIHDLPYLSATCKYFNSLLSAYSKITSFTKVPLLENCSTLLLCCEEDSSMYPDCDNDNIKIQHFKELTALKGGIFEFEILKVGGRYLSEYQEYIPPAKEIHLYLGNNLELNLNLLDAAFLCKVTMLEIRTGTPHTLKIFHQMHRMSRLKKLDIYSSGDLESREIDFNLLFREIQKTRIDSLCIQSLYFNQHAVKFGEMLSNSSIRRICLDSCRLGNSFLIEISKVLSASNLTDLILKGNGISDEGVIFLAKHLHSSKLQELDLACNSIAFAGLNALAESLPGTRIKDFSISNNNFDKDEYKVLFGILPSTNIETMHFDDDGDLQGIGRIHHSNVKTVHASFSSASLCELMTLTSDSKLKSINFLFETQIELLETMLDDFFKYLDKATIESLTIKNRMEDKITDFFSVFNICNPVSITHLDIDNISFAEDYMYQIYTGFEDTRLETLIFRNTDLSDRKLAVFGHGIAKSGLKRFEIIGHDRITWSGIVAFVKQVMNSNLTCLNFGMVYTPVQVREIREILVGSKLHFQLQ